MTTVATLPVVAVSEDDRLSKMTVVALKEEAKARGFKGYSTKRKPELIAMLLGGAPIAPRGGLTIPQLKEAIKTRGGKGYSGKSKKELEEMLARLPQ